MNVSEIFVSVDGEVTGFHQGRVSSFLRLQGCNLNCAYCDTEHAKGPNGGEKMGVGEVFKRLRRYNTKKITITGGEPLIQSNQLYKLVDRLLNDNRWVSIETNGSLRVKPMLDVSYVVDYKLPSSGESQRMTDENFADLGRMDWVKFVIGTIEDYNRACVVMEKLKQLGCNAQYAMSPMFQGREYDDWVINQLIHKDRLDVVINLQLHKVLSVK